MDSCGFSSNNGAYLISPAGNALETIDRTPAGRSYVEAGDLRFAATNEEVAEAVVRQWFDTARFNERLTYENAMRIGVGVEIVRNGNVYTTANLC
jgi:opacity protein-like surface antigen